MSATLLDTHTWAWSLFDSTRLTVVAKDAIAASDTVWISPASVFEIAQKVRLRKWPEMAPLVDKLLPTIERQAASMTRMDGAICLAAGRASWRHRDPFDRILAATALAYGLPIISADRIFDGIVPRIW